MDLPDAPLPSPYTDEVKQRAQALAGGFLGPSGSPWGTLARGSIAGLRSLLPGSKGFGAEQNAIRGAEGGSVIPEVQQQMNQQQQQEYRDNLPMMLSMGGGGPKAANEPMPASRVPDINAFKVKQLFKKAIQAEQEAGPGIKPSVDFSPDTIDAMATKEAHKLPAANQPTPSIKYALDSKPDGSFHVTTPEGNIQKFSSLDKANEYIAWHKSLRE